MDTATFKKSLVELTDKLLFTSESEYPFEILDWNNKSLEEVKKAIVSEHSADPEITTISATDFFNHYIHILEIDKNERALAVAERYKKLQSFITSNSREINVYKCGKIQVGLYIVITTEDDEIIVLKTVSIET